MSLDFSDDFRFGAYISGPGFSGTAPSRSGLMAVMINSYKAQSIFARGPQLRTDCRTRLGRSWGGPRNLSGRRGRPWSYSRLFGGFLAVSLPMHLKPGTDALAAGSLAEIGHRGGNLEGAIELLLRAKRIMRDRVVADARQSCAERRPGRKDVEFDQPFVAEHLTGSGRGGRRQCHQWHVTRSRGGLAERFGD